MPIIEGPVSFINYIEGASEIVVDGVVRNYGMEPPSAINDADMPVQFLQLPVSNRERFALAIEGSDTQGTGLMTIEVVVVLGAVALDLPRVNFTDSVEMVDALARAYIHADIALSWPVVSIRVTPDVIVAGIAYWAAIATVTARG